MSFIPEARIENRAADIWRRHALEPAFSLEVLLDKLDLGLLWDGLPADVLGALNPEDSLVILNETRLKDFEATPGLERFTIAHEVGHWILHGDEARSGVLPMLDGGRTWCRDGSRKPPEIQADMFASYLLMPTDLLRPLVPTLPWRGWPIVYKLAERFAVSATAMIVRLERAGWAYRDDQSVPVGGRRATDDGAQGSLPLM